MKKIALSLVAAAAATLSTGAMAQFYIAGDVGQGHASGFCAGADVSCSDNGTAIKLTGGYKLGQGFSAEVGYLDFGDASSYGYKISSSGFTVGAAYELPVAPHWNAVARLGLASLEAKVTSDNLSGSETNTEFYYGLGANFAVSRNVKLQAAIDWSHGEFEGDTAVLRAITVGARYEF
jgi:OOP family OmpA-OmpF porin